MNKLDGEIPAEQEPILLFLHGTASSTQGSFGKLWEPGNHEGERTRQRLKDTYSNRVYAFEHLSMTLSPIDNALDLARALPVGAQLHIVSHSRGGLVGELLCLGQRRLDPDPIDPNTLDKIYEKDRTMGWMLGLGPWTADEYADQRKKLGNLLSLLDKKQLRITRFVRVACPARGTTLASGRLDRWLSIIGFLTKETVAGDAVDFLLGVVKERTDPRTLPGLEAMMPGSALVRLLNYPALEVSSDLSIIAGDIEGESFWGKLKWTLADWFYSSDHDLVVNTGSMYGGVKRPRQGARFLMDKGKDVNHFNYFANQRTVKWLMAGLTRADGTMGGFAPVEAAKQEAPAWRFAIARSLTAGPRPIALVLPGTMGSQLKVGDDRIWLSYWDLARGKFRRLNIDAAEVSPIDLVSDFYGDFLTYLSRGHRVVPFAYDWRQSVQKSAEELRQRLEEDLLPYCENHKQPIRILAHSMGGLVVRAMIGKHKALWDRIRALAGSRFIMFGTPNAGSYEAIRWITGSNPTLNKLCLLDVMHDRDELLEVVTRFPGLLELLPFNEPRDFTKSRLWQNLHNQMDESWPLPLEKDLDTARETQRLIDESPIDKDNMIYVAGSAPMTISNYEVVMDRPDWDFLGEKRPVMRYYGNAQGDGTVSWKSGLLPGITTWYVEQTAHDELMSHEPAFPAYLDLIQTGTTQRLLQSAPQAKALTTRSAAWQEELLVMPRGATDSRPAEDEACTFTFGSSRPERKQNRRKLPKVALTIRHGDLAYASHPICVGHYMGDTIVSAEAHLDRRLDGALTRRVRLGLYPGPIGTHEVFINQQPREKPSGALIVGLGHVGELSPGTLESGIGKAIMNYALTVSDWPDDRFGPKGTPRSASLTCLLIGTGFGCMTPKDSIESILRGVRTANQRLAETGVNDDQVLVDKIEFLELYEDVAILAARALTTILLNSDLADHFEWKDAQVEEGQGGHRRVLFEEAQDWWHRLEIGFDVKRDELRFIALTDRARAEETLVAGQMRLADDFIRAACAQAGNTQEISRTLFEMLLPNRLKEMTPNHNDVVLLVDQISARFPWELLEDRWAIGGRPLSVAAGMLRQLKTPRFRPKPVYPLGNHVFVVGNPKVPPGDNGVQFADLPGAEREAIEVETLLRQGGMTVSSHVRADAQDILIGLHRNGYKILHLAGHGVHDLELEVDEGPSQTCQSCDKPIPKRKKRVSGMVIGKNVFLTPGDVEQMRWVPELVFINCCYLGATTSESPEQGRYNALAANIATQFIEMGVKAVVAAGWAVDDSAALAFARSFYQHMLLGSSFGDAVRAAREEIYERYPNANTWGAYQCYGDPGFRIREGETTSRGKTVPYHAPVELLTDIGNLTSGARMNAARDDDKKIWLDKLDQMLDLVPKDRRRAWTTRADINAALGLFYGELGQYDEAIKHLDGAVASDRANFSVQALEQRADLQVKRTMRDWLATQLDTQAGHPEKSTKRRGSKQSGSNMHNQIEAVRAAISELEALSRMSETKERLSRLGSAYKRLAWMQTEPDASQKAMHNMAKNYERAFELAKEHDKMPSATCLINWLTAEIILAWLDDKRDQKKWRHGIAQWCEEAVAEAQRRETSDPSFWNSVVEPGCKLIEAIAQDKLDIQTDADEINSIAYGYVLALDRGASQRDEDSIREHFDFIAAMADRAEKANIATAIREIRSRL